MSYSPSVQIEVVTFNDSFPAKIPTLVPLVNALLHFQASSHLFERFLLTAQFHSLIGHFANLGPLARHYLLKTGTLGRLLRVLFINCNSKVGLTGPMAAQFALEFDQESSLAKRAPLFLLN